MARASEHRRDNGLSLGELGLERFAPYLISKALSRWLEALREMLREHDLSVTQMRTLGALAVRFNPSIQELSDLTMTEPSTMSRTLDALQERGLIRRETRERDGRLRVIACTEKGYDTFAAVWPHMRDMYEAMMTDISPAERDAFLSTLQKVIRNLEAETDSELRD